MKTNCKKISLICLSALLFVGCGKQFTAKQTVANFVEENARTPYSITDAAELDSTSYVTDKAIALMRRSAKDKGLFKPETRYGERPKHTKTLMMLKITCSPTDAKGATKELRQTFYLNPELTQVIAVKNN